MNEETEQTSGPWEFQLLVIHAEEVGTRNAWLVALDANVEDHVPLVCLGVLTVSNPRYARTIEEEIKRCGRYLLHPLE